MPDIGDFFMARASKTWIGLSLRYACGQDYVHSGVYIGDGLVIDNSIRYGKRGAQIDRVADLTDPQWSTIDLTGWQRHAIADAAVSMIGRPFPGFVPMAVGVLRRHRGDVTRPYVEQPWWVRQLLNGEHTVYCLQVPYYAYLSAGIDLFPDGRPEGLVRPVDMLPLVGASRV